jgi:imidazolonepropionase
VALSTDLNPGSSPTQNLWLMATMGCSALRMTAEEVIRAITIEAAAALALDHEVGSLEAGKKADILILDETRTAELPYRYGMNPVWRVFKEGRLVVKREFVNEV